MSSKVCLHEPEVDERQETRRKQSGGGAAARGAPWIHAGYTAVIELMGRAPWIQRCVSLYLEAESGGVRGERTSVIGGDSNYEKDHGNWESEHLVAPNLGNTDANSFDCFLRATFF